LGQAVVTSARVPVRIRQALNVESGLNDGIAVPFVSIFIAGAAAAGGLGTAGFWTELVAKQIGFGLLVGVGVGVASGLLIQYATATRWMNHTFQQLAILAVPLLGFAVAEQVGGNGFIAAFVAGIAIGNVTRRVGHRLFEFVEEEGQLLVLLTFMIFGGAFVGPALGDLTWQIALYAVLSLTVVRMVPVAISMIGMRFQVDTVAFLGWFGPRGLASIVFGLLVLESSVDERGAIFVIVTWTVLLSVVVHGLSARPSVDWYGAKAEMMADEPDMPEMEAVEEMPTRGMA
jgi:NhaP-type Na+/H+ or K+/H+ antiporter